MKILKTKPKAGSGYRPLTSGYRLPQEKAMLDNVVADLRRGKIDHVLVRGRDGVSVWRRGRSGGAR
jgi:hypothetical protein